jgi:hypothetical protein
MSSQVEWNSPKMKSADLARFEAWNLVDRPTGGLGPIEPIMADADAVAPITKGRSVCERSSVAILLRSARAA